MRQGLTDREKVEACLWEAGWHTAVVRVVDGVVMVRRYDYQGLEIPKMMVHKAFQLLHGHSSLQAQRVRLVEVPGAP